MARCITPIYIEKDVYFSQEDRLIPVPCGKCPNCLNSRISSWQFRLEREVDQWQNIYFVTFTYADHQLPWTQNGFATLQKKDMQDYFKRLRYNTRGKLRYYLAGEYGTNTQRPHYHVILYTDGKIDQDAIIRAWINPENDDLMGHVHFGYVTPASIRYTVAYMEKGAWQPQNEQDDRQPQYSAMSKGLGRAWLNEQIDQFINKRPDKQYVTLKGGTKIAIPKYYRYRLHEYVPPERVLREHPSYLVHYYDEMQTNKLLFNQHSKLLTDEESTEFETREQRADIEEYTRNYARRSSNKRNTL